MDFCATALENIKQQYKKKQIFNPVFFDVV
jgi:hypothetical protein